MAATSARRCGTCELLRRSETPGLITYGKCPSRSGWVRTQDEACADYLAERNGGLVRVVMGLNLAAATIGLATTVTVDLLYGTRVTHVILVVGVIAVAVFAWLVRRSGMFSEEAKYDLLESTDLPVEDDDRDRWP